MAITLWSAADYGRWSLHICGGLFIYAALLYEDEERAAGRAQSKLEELWIRLKDKQDASLSKGTSFLRIVATITGKGFDRLFGKRLLSLQFVVTSIYLSLASLLLSIAVLSRIAPNPKLGSFSGTLLQASVFGIAGLLPALTKN